MSGHPLPQIAPKSAFRARLGIQTPGASPRRRLKSHSLLPFFRRRSHERRLGRLWTPPAGDRPANLRFAPASASFFTLFKSTFTLLKLPAASGQLTAIGDRGPGHAIAKDAENAKAPANCRRPLSLVICHYAFSIRRAQLPAASYRRPDAGETISAHRRCPPDIRSAKGGTPDPPKAEHATRPASNTDRSDRPDRPDRTRPPAAAALAATLLALAPAPAAAATATAARPPSWP